MHVVVVHDDTYVLHKAPVQGPEHVQLTVFGPDTEHVALFKQGFDKHTLMRFWQFVPLKPGLHVQK